MNAMRLTRIVGVLNLATLAFAVTAECIAQELSPSGKYAGVARNAVDRPSSYPACGTTLDPLAGRSFRGEGYLDRAPVGPLIPGGWVLPRIEAVALKELFERVSQLRGAAPSNPAIAGAHFEQANTAYEAKDFDRAIAESTETIRMFPGFAEALHLRAKARQMKKDLDGAITDETEAIRLDPSNSEAYYWRANAFCLKGEYSKGVDDLSRVIQIDPTSLNVYQARARARLRTGDSDGAIADCAEVIRLRPEDANALILRGSFLAMLGKFDRAVVDYDAAMRIDFEEPRAHTDLAWILASCSDAKVRDGRRAIAEATGACELTGWQDFRALSALAAAHASVGDFEEAKRSQAAALKLNASARDKARGRLCLFLNTLHLCYRFGADVESRPEPGKSAFSIGAGVSDMWGRYVELKWRTHENRWHFVWANGRPFLYEKY
jgi:tetratricopeptide (TPR) repeat protein